MLVVGKELKNLQAMCIIDDLHVFFMIALLFVKLLSMGMPSLQSPKQYWIHLLIRPYLFLLHRGICYSYTLVRVRVDLEWSRTVLSISQILKLAMTVNTAASLQTLPVTTALLLVYVLEVIFFIKEGLRTYLFSLHS